MVVKMKHLPIFEEYELKALSERLGYTRRYLLDMDEGLKPVNVRFVSNACRILNRLEQDLFGDWKKEEVTIGAESRVHPHREATAEP